MPLIKCPDCSKFFSDSIDQCPKCGAVVSDEQKAEIKKKQDKLAKGCGLGCLGMVMIPLVLFIIAAIAGSQMEEPEPRIENSSWDGSVYQVKLWLEKNLLDPDSLEFIEWSPIEELEDGGYRVRAKYRAKNTYGGFVIEEQLFYLDTQGTVTDALDYQ